jgi:hypothetical protein
VNEPVVFNPAGLPGKDRRFVEEAAALRGLMRASVENLVAIGRKLTAVKQRLPHGQFGPWLLAEFRMSVDAAERYMNVTRVVPLLPRYRIFLRVSSGVTERPAEFGVDGGAH